MAAKRDYKAEYKKFQSSPAMIRYRELLNKYNRKRGTYGLAYGKNGEKGVGSVTYNGKTYKPGDQGYENAKGVFMKTINQKEAAEKRMQEIKKKKRNK